MAGNGGIKAKRERAVNYTEQETRLLVDIVLDHKDIIENKVSDAVTWKEKSEAWEKVAASFNARNLAVVQRDSSVLKSKYESIKKGLKKKVASEKCGLYITGGGSKILIIYKDWEEKLLSVLKLSICGLDSSYDSDRTTLQQDLPLPASSATAVPPLPASSATAFISSENDFENVSVPVPHFQVVQADETDIDLIEVDLPDNVEIELETSMIEKTASTSDNCPTNKWDNWKPTLLRTKKSAVLRKQHTKVTKKDTIVNKYDLLANERSKLIILQMEIAKKELEMLNAKAIHQEEMQMLEKQKLLRSMEQQEEEHKLKIDKLKQ